MAGRLLLPTNARRYPLAWAGLVLAAWGLLTAWQRTPYAGLLSHDSLGEDGPSLLRLGAFLLGWLLMTVAMMLPGSLPALNRPQPDRSLATPEGRLPRGRTAGLIVLGYLAPWALFGLLFYLGDSALHRMAAPGEPLAGAAGMIAPGMVLVAGLYQLTPFKRIAMEGHRFSHALARAGGAETESGAGALRQGLMLGLACVGSCWAMMLLMAAVGHHRLDWMLVLGGVMAAERLTPWGQRLAWLVGFLLILWATYWLLGTLGPLPAGHSQH